jgi:hypothetical protein
MLSGSLQLVHGTETLLILIRYQLDLPVLREARFSLMGRAQSLAEQRLRR